MVETRLILNFSYIKHKSMQNMLPYCLKCKKNTKHIIRKILRTSNAKIMLSSKWAVCGSKISRFMKEQKEKKKEYYVV